jgi:hypothetical protein
MRRFELKIHSFATGNPNIYSNVCRRETSYNKQVNLKKNKETMCPPVNQTEL